MPVFDNCPEEAERYRRDFVNYWPEAVRHVYEVLVQTIGATTDPKDKISLIKGMTEIKPPIEFNDKNDDNMGKRHAFGDAIDAVRHYLIERIGKGYLPKLSDVLSDVKADPKYASFSLEIG